MMDFFDLPTARSRLCESVIKVTNRPFYVIGVDPLDGRGKTFRILGVFCKSKTDDPEDFKLDDDRVDLTPIPLGFVNKTRTCVLLTREPKRMWKIGLHQENVAARVLTPDGLLYDRINFSETVLSDGFRSAVLGNYPTLKDLILDNKILHGSRAFSRDWAIQKLPQTETVNLVHKFHGVVGKLNGIHPELNEKFGFLHEALQEELKG